MPIYFNDVAPFCPVSRDQPVGPMTAPVIRTTIPHAHDLPSAIAAVNIARTIITQLAFNYVINNVFTPPPTKQPTPQPPKEINKERTARWTEVTSARVKRAYKYYGKDENGKDDKSIWIMTERIEHMVWRDAGWKTSLEFIYGNKGEGEPVGGGGAAASGNNTDSGE